MGIIRLVKGGTSVKLFQYRTNYNVNRLDCEHYFTKQRGWPWWIDRGRTNWRGVHTASWYRKDPLLDHHWAECGFLHLDHPDSDVWGLINTF